MTKTLQTLLVALGIISFTAAGSASTLTLTMEHHASIAQDHGGRRVLRTLFSEEPLVAQVRLDVYAVPQLPYTSSHLTELQALPRQTWDRELNWEVVNSAGLAQRVRPRLLNSAVHDRGPDASNEADRTAVPCTTYEATFDIGHLPPGDYKVQVSVRGIASGTFPLNVRTGSEPEVRDIYLQEKAKKTRDWDEFKQLQLERLRLDPTKAGALLELAQRSLESGTLDETNGYLGRAATTMEQNMREWAKLNPTDAQKQAPLAERSVAAVRALQRALPEYFAHRAEWHVTTDPTTGAYVIKTRDSDRVVRIIR